MKMNVKIIYVALTVAVSFAILGNSYVSYPWEHNSTKNVTVSKVPNGLKKFNSPDEIELFLKKNRDNARYGGYFGKALDMAVSPMTQTRMLAAGPMAMEESAADIPTPGTRTDDFSTTNIQVAGVDEADIVKNDGKYIYTLSKNKIFIVDAYPPEDAEILSTIKIKGTPLELYINKDRLIVLGNDYSSIEYAEQQEKVAPSRIAPEEVEIYPSIEHKAVMLVYDITNRENPELVKEVTVDGNYFDSRMIDDYVYLIATDYPRYYEDALRTPEVTESAWGVKKTERPDVYYFDVPGYSYAFTTIASINTQVEQSNVEGKVYLLGSTQNLFVSRNNVYITYQKIFPEPYFYERIVDEVVEPLVPDSISLGIRSIKDSNKTLLEKEREIEKILTEYLGSLPDTSKTRFNKGSQERMLELERELAKETEKTVVHKITIADGQIEYVASGEMPGSLLNQFSMDEFEGYFRAATTTGHVSGRGVQTSANHIYILDEDLKMVSAVEDLAPGERIYSARFMGNRVYLVTFQKVDPLFVIDLGDPREPKILGKLKIPGYSDYLHPYDENHIIGLGKDTVESEEGNFAWYQGLKLALFDVSDVKKPKEISKVVIGDRGTDSTALHDHKAFLFSREKNLLVIPVLLAEIDSEKYPQELPEWTHGEYVWQGAYVFHINAESGIKLKGRISHNTERDGFLKSGRYYYGFENSIKRSLYMGEALYTLSNEMIKVNDLKDLEEIESLYLK
jgi:uncharacterized secreted protein with C-terminal beta-propeller domain